MNINKKCQFDVEISESTVNQFAKLSGDFNPLHVDPQYASTTQFKGPVAHGALLISYVSQVLGMHIPGKKCLIMSMKVKFPEATLYPTTVRIKAENKFFDEEKQVGSVAINITDQKRHLPVLESEVLYTFHGKAIESLSDKIAHSEEKIDLLKNTNKPALLVTGGTGGIGQTLLAELQSQYQIVCCTRSKPKSPTKDIRYVEVNLEDNQSLETVLSQLDARQFYGILHMSSAPLSRGFLSSSREEVERQMQHAVYVPLTLAKWAQGTDSGIQRIILFGSTAGTKEPNPQKGAYSLAKASVEKMVPLLAWDMARQKATVNMLIPGFIATGMNKGVPERVIRTLEGKIPTGRLTSPMDIYQAVRFFLSDESGQINGASLVIDGGQLD
jgi:NAD(P)-dependent dehydrogenase (short-subunit alcohol dehydrogenase family)/acyl dehydratase